MKNIDSRFVKKWLIWMGGQFIAFVFGAMFTLQLMRICT